MANTIMSRNDAKTYIARIIGGAGDPAVLDMAEEALMKGFSDWQTARNWEGLLKDGSLGGTVPFGTLQADNATIIPSIIGDYDGLNIGVSLTGPGVPLGATLQSYTRNVNGQINSITVTPNIISNNLFIGTTAPSARYSHMSFYDPINRRMIMYGGSTVDEYSNSTETWALDCSGVGGWTQLTTAGSAPAAVLRTNIVYDPIRVRALIFGGYHYSASFETGSNSVKALSLTGTTPTWSTLTTAGTPPTARSSHSMIYDPVYDRLIIFGGSGVSGGERNDVWALSLVGTPTWTLLSPTGTPPSTRQAHTAIYDSLNAQMIVFGGSHGGSRVTDTWSLSLGASPAWTLLSPTGTPPATRNFASSIYDPVNQCMVVTCGTGATIYNDVWTLSLSGSPVWTEITPTPTFLTQRWSTTAIYDPLYGRMIIFGGSGLGDVRLNDTWIMSFAALGATLTYSGDIPIIAGIQDYNIPLDFFRPYVARMTSNKQWPVDFIRPRYWNRRTINDKVQGVIEAYTIFNTNSSNTQGNGTKRLRVFRIPSAPDTLRLTYYRKFDVLSDPLDMEDDFLYKFLDYCSSILLDRKRAGDNPSEYKQQVTSNMQAAMTADEETTEDEDIRLISQMEMGDAQKPLWTNGPFNPDYGY